MITPASPVDSTKRKHYCALDCETLLIAEYSGDQNKTGHPGFDLANPHVESTIFSSAGFSFRDHNVNTDFKKAAVMRILIHYLFAIAVLTIYGAQV